MSRRVRQHGEDRQSRRARLFRQDAIHRGLEGWHARQGKQCRGRAMGYGLWAMGYYRLRSTAYRYRVRDQTPHATLSTPALQHSSESPTRGRWEKGRTPRPGTTHRHAHTPRHEAAGSELTLKPLVLTFSPNAGPQLTTRDRRRGAPAYRRTCMEQPSLKPPPPPPFVCPLFFLLNWLPAA